MSKNIDDLIEAHKAAYNAFLSVVQEEERASDLESETEHCVVDLLIAANGEAGCITGDSSDAMRQKIEEAYQAAETSICFMRRYDRDAFDKVAALLDDLRRENLAMVETAHKAWVKDRASQAKKRADINSRYETAEAADMAAACAVLRYRPRSREEELKRAAYVAEAGWVGTISTGYADALLETFLTPDFEQEHSAG